MSLFDELIRPLLRKIGCDIIRYQPRTHPLSRRKSLLDAYSVGTILDIGANIGQYGVESRKIGYTGRIISFEPQSVAFKALSLRAQADNLWDVHNFALGDKEEISHINISENSYSSSLLDILPAHVESAPDSRYKGQEEISVKTLDAVFSELTAPEDQIYLKIDTQGFEEQVLLGARDSLGHIDTIQLEMSLMPLYQNGMLFDEMYRFLYEKGYRLVALEPGFTNDDTGELLQVDGIFHRR